MISITHVPALTGTTTFTFEASTSETMSREGEAADRAQLVLAAAAVVVVALAPVVLAYLQLGVHPDVRPPAPEPGENAARFLERATHEAGANVTGEHGWDGRERAVTAVHEQLDPRLETLEASRVASGTVYTVSYNATAAAAWASANCPGGPGREFGTCTADRGVVVQERAGETTVVAVAYDVQVTSERAERSLTLVVRVVGAS